MIRLCGAALGFLAFGVTILVGLWSNNTFEDIITRALWAMLMFFMLGMVTGWVAYRVLDEHALRKSTEYDEEFEKAQAAMQAEIATESVDPEDDSVSDTNTTETTSVPSGDQETAAIGT